MSKKAPEQESTQEPVGGEIGHKASEMAEQIEVTARDLARVGQEAATLAGGLVRKVAGGLKSKPEGDQEGAADAADAADDEVDGQAHELTEALRKTTEDALRIAQKAVEMASKIAQAPAGGSKKPTD